MPRNEAVHEFLGGEIQNLALAHGVPGPGDRLQQVRLAEPDAGMDVKRIEHHRVAALGGGHLLGGGLGERVGAADHEGLEGQPGVERRAAERLMPRRIADRQRPAVAGDVEAATVAGSHLGLGLGLDDGRAQYRRPHDQLDAADFRLLRLPACQHPFGIVRLDPALEETRRHR
jgi:hypothetical protein